MWQRPPKENIMKLTRNVTERTTVSLHKWAKQDLKQLSLKLNIDFDKLINIAIANLLEENHEHFHKDIIKAALEECQLCVSEHKIFHSPFIKVEESWSEDGSSAEFKVDLLDAEGNVTDHSERTINWNDEADLNEYLERLSLYIPYEADIAKDYIANRFSYLSTVKGGL